jgi:cytochrome c-type biogenesis protein CcmH
MDPRFLVIAAALTAIAVGIVLFGLRRNRNADASRAQLNAAVLRQRLDELERERASGLLPTAEFEAAQDELRRRALTEAVDAVDTPAAAPRIRRVRVPVLAAALSLPVLALGIYLVAGSPHLLQSNGIDVAAAPAPASGADAAAATDAGAAATASPHAAGGGVPPAMLAQLEAHVASSPSDARAWVLLGRARMDAGQFGPAAVAYERAIAAQAKVAKDPTIWCEYADAVGMSQGGQLAGKPKELIDKALQLDATSACGLEMAGSAAIEARDFRAAQTYWQQLLKQLPEGSAQHLQLATALDRIEAQAKFSLPSPGGTPSSSGATAPRS